MAVYLIGHGVQAVQQAYQFIPIDRTLKERQLALETALTSRLAPGRRAEVLDSEAGGTLAMARAHLRQATSDLYWFFFTKYQPDRRRTLMDKLQAAPPAAILVTINRDRMSPVEDWLSLDQFLAANYTLVDDHPVENSGHPWESGAAGWKLYIVNKTSSAYVVHLDAALPGGLRTNGFNTSPPCRRS